VPDRCARRPPTLSALFGGICGTEILQATNFDVSIQSAVTSWISIVRPQSSRSNWTVVGITIAPDRFAIERDRNFWLATGSLCSDFGIIRFARNSTASCKRSGLRCRSAARRNPHLNPLPLAKGEASFWSGNCNGIDKWRDSSLIQQRNPDEPNCDDTAGLSDLQKTEIA
jgi:hypothetical protein